MADVYYAVAGHPVNHSLSPVLVNIVAQYVSDQLTAGQRFNVIQTDLVDAKYIQDALAWGYVCLLYTSPSPRDMSASRMPSSA